MSLTSILKKHKKQNNFVDKLYDEFSKPSFKRFRGNYNHVTNILSGKCDEYWQMIKEGEMKEQEFSASKNLIFERGRVFDTIIKDKLNILYPGKIIGRWINRNGEIRFINKDLVGFEYHELRVKSEKHKVMGHIDLCYLDDNGFIHPLEVKSISAAGFMKLRQPKASNKRQALTYAELLELDQELIATIEEVEGIKIKGIGDPILLYVCSEYVKCNPFKNFHIKRDYVARQEIIRLLDNNINSFQSIIKE